MTRRGAPTSAARYQAHHQAGCARSESARIANIWQSLSHRHQLDRRRVVGDLARLSIIARVIGSDALATGMSRKPMTDSARYGDTVSDIDVLATQSPHHQLRGGDSIK